MEISRAYRFLKIFVLFIAALIAEYIFCGFSFRMVRHRDLIGLDIASALSSFGLGYWFFKDTIRAALKEKVPPPLVAACFLAFWVLLGCFLRMSAQLANGLLDFSDPQTRLVVVTDKKISSFGGSLKEGPNPMAHLVYFSDWENADQTCEVLAPPALYYSLDPGIPMLITLRTGLFHWAWAEDLQLLKVR